MSERGKRVWAVGVMAAAALVFTGPALAAGMTMAATDVLTVGAPYRERLVDRVVLGNSSQVDQAEQLAPVVEFYRSLRDGRVQLWEPDVGTGVPLLPAVYNRILAPWFLAFLAVPEAVAPTVAVALALFVAQLGTFGLARRLGLSTEAAVFAGVAYAFSGPAMVFVLRIHELFLLPLLLYALHGAVTGDRRRGGFAALAAVTAAFVWFSGFPAAALMVFYFSAAWIAYLAFEHARRGSDPAGRMRAAAGAAWMPVAALAAGTALAAPQLFPSLEFLAESGALEREYGAFDTIALPSLATAVSGRFYGALQDKDWWFPLAVFARSSIAVIATMGAVVIALLVALVLGRSRGAGGEADRAVSRFFLPAGVVILAAVYVGGPLLWLANHLPYMHNNWFGRSRFIAALAIALTAAYALHGLLERRGERPPVPAPARVQAAVVVAAVLAGLVWGLGLAADHGKLALVGRNVVVPAIALAATLAALAAARRAPPLVVASVIVAALGVELQWSGWLFTPASPSSTFYPRDPAYRAIERDTGPGGLYRFFSPDFRSVRPMSAAALDLKDVRVAFPSHERYRDLLTAADPGVFVTGRLKTYFTERLDPASPVLDALSARYLALPLSAPLLGVGHPADARVPARRAPMSFALGTAPGRIRGIELALEPELRGCRRGWAEIRVSTAEVEVRSRRLLRDVTPPRVRFALPDVAVESPVRVHVGSTHCPVRTSSRIARLLPASGTRDLRVVGVDGWALYRRGRALPRVALARAAVRIDERAARLAFLARRGAGDPRVAVEHGPASQSFAGGRARLVRDDPDTIVVSVRSRGPGLLVLRDVAAPGWSVRVGGRAAEMVVVDHAFRGARVPDGETTVEFRYAPASMRNGLWIAAAGGALTVALAAHGRVRTRRRARGSER